ncbi:hypothetical protein KI387_007482, partial [Taxus chinensis]
LFHCHWLIPIQIPETMITSIGALLTCHMSLLFSWKGIKCVAPVNVVSSMLDVIFDGNKSEHGSETEE